jgi:predicted ATPase
MDAYDLTKEGSARVVLVAGEPGIGRTRLLDEIELRATGDGAVVLRGGSSQAEGMPPYLPFLEALGRYIQITPLNLLREQVAAAPQVLASLDLLCHLARCQSHAHLLLVGAYRENDCYSH